MEESSAQHISIQEERESDRNRDKDSQLLLCTSMSAPIQSISITRVENRTLPTPHVVYAVLIVLPVRSWTVYRRYSEFFQLHQSLLQSHNGLPSSPPPPAPFPPKHTARRTFKAISGLGGLLPQGESAKEAEEAQAKERKEALERYLRAIVASTDSSWRNTDAFKEFIELPKSGSGVSVSHPSNSPAGSRYVPGSYSSAPSNGSSATNRVKQSTSSAEPGAFTTRTLGQRAPAKETEATRALDEAGLFASQQAQMDSQDAQLEDLATVLRRQKAMGLAINQELLEQTELLDSLDQQVDQTQNKMVGAERQMKKLGG